MSTPCSDGKGAVPVTRMPIGINLIPYPHSLEPTSSEIHTVLHTACLPYLYNLLAHSFHVPFTKIKRSLSLYTDCDACGLPFTAACCSNGRAWARGLHQAFLIFTLSTNDPAWVSSSIRTQGHFPENILFVAVMPAKRTEGLDHLKCSAAG